MDCKRTYEMLGGKIEFVIYDSDERIAGDIFEDLRVEALRLQRVFNFYDKESELSKLNQKRKAEVSNELLEVINEALKYCKLTDGKYDISLGRLFKERKSGRKDAEIGCSYKDISVKGNRVELMHADVLVDLGSIAKGYIGDKIVEKLKDLGVESGLVDMRGDIRIFGKVGEKMSIENPRDSKKSDFPFVLQNMSVATSGDYKQFYGARERSHIISKTDIASVTVIAESLMKADVLATAVFVSDDESLKELIKKHKEERFVIIKRDGKYLTFNWFKNQEE